LRTDQEDESRKARVEQMRLHATAVRQMLRLLRPGRRRRIIWRTALA
jgi:F-type H+-transporting ATPase subunit epsilon